MTNEFDLERLKQLHHKAEQNDLTDEEIQELNAMLAAFTETVEPLMQTMGEIYADAARDLMGALEPLAEYADEYETHE